MKFNEVFGGVVVKDGYTMLALVNDGDSFHAIIRRNNVGDFVFCHWYDIKDGTWGQGEYCESYVYAVNRMCKYLHP